MLTESSFANYLFYKEDAVIVMLVIIGMYIVHLDLNNKHNWFSFS